MGKGGPKRRMGCFSGYPPVAITETYDMARRGPGCGQAELA